MVPPFLNPLTGFKVAPAFSFNVVKDFLTLVTKKHDRNPVFDLVLGCQRGLTGAGDCTTLAPLVPVKVKSLEVDFVVLLGWDGS